MRQAVNLPLVLEREADSDTDSETGNELYCVAADDEVGEGSHEVYAKEFLFTPQPGLYRCMAISVYGGGRYAKLLGITVCVVLLQMLGTCCLFGMHRRTVRKHTYQYMGAHLYSQKRAQDKEDLGILTWAWHNEYATVLLQKKLLGTLLMVLVYQHIDRTLLDQDCELYNLRRYFPGIKMRWLNVETICNGLCGCIVGFILGGIMDEQEGVLGIIVDAIGVLFLLNLDDMAAGFNYAISETVFSDVVDKKQKAWAERYRKGAIDAGSKHGISWLSITILFFRAMNLFLFFVNVPFYATTCMVTEESHTDHGTPHSSHQMPMLPVFAETFGCWIYVSITMALILITFNIATFTLVDERSRRSLDEAQIEKKDLDGFISLVILRRPDPRWAERCSLENASKQDM